MKQLSSSSMSGVGWYYISSKCTRK